MLGRRALQQVLGGRIGYQLIGHQRAALSTTPSLSLKEITRETEGNKTVIQAKYITSPREGKVVPNALAEKKVCPLCTLDLNLKYTDVLILSQFVRPDGRIVPRRITGVCKAQQTELTFLITMAKKAGLMPNLAPQNSHCDPQLRRGNKKLRRHFDEMSIKNPRIGILNKMQPGWSEARMDQILKERQKS